MSSPILGLKTIIYKVADFAKAKEWYSSAFNTKPYFDQLFYIGFPDNSTGVKSDNAIAYWGVYNIQKEFDWLI